MNVYTYTLGQFRRLARRLYICMITKIDIDIYICMYIYTRMCAQFRCLARRLYGHSKWRMAYEHVPKYYRDVVAQIPRCGRMIQFKDRVCMRLRVFACARARALCVYSNISFVCECFCMEIYCVCVCVCVCMFVYKNRAYVRTWVTAPALYQWYTYVRM